MPFLDAKPRSWEAYLAGIGASGVLMNILGGSSTPGPGGVVGGLGQTLNSTLQRLAGTN